MGEPGLGDMGGAGTGSVFGQRGGPGGAVARSGGATSGTSGTLGMPPPSPAVSLGMRDGAQAVRRRLLHGLLAFLQEVTQEVEGQQAEDPQHALGEAEEPAVSAAPLAAPTQHRTDSETRAVRSHC